MQNLIFYVSAASTLGVAKDSLGVKNIALPTIIRGGEVCLKMRLFAGDGDDTPLPLDELTRCTAWEWAMDSDFDESTNYKLVADNANITVGSVTETDPEGVEHTYTEISIPIPATNTEELKEWLGTSESQNNLNGELAGYDATGKLTYILQLKGFTIRNRILSAGDPTELPERYLDEAGVRALIGAGAEAQCATAADAPDGDWVDSTTAPDTHVWIRWRLRGNPSGAWSTPAKRIPGPAGATGDKGDKGDTGATGLVEIVSIEMTAPATSPSITEAEGSTAEHRKYILHIPRGEKGDTGTDGTDGADGAAAGFGTPTVTVETLPAGSDATASVTASGDDTAKIFNFNFGIPKGADGSGAGDMLKSVYDTDDDGIVDHAAAADAVGATTATQVADAVGKAHTHANKTTLDKLAEADGKLTYDGAEIGGGSGTVKSVNGQLPDESGNVTIETGGVVDESRLLPTGGKDGDILGYQEGVDRGNGADVRLLLQNALTDSANGNAAPAAVTTQGVTLTGDNNLLFDGNDSHVTAVLATDEIFAADKEWTIDFWMKPTANSSEWNYILTENRGDWGSHSIGLTWNKTKNVLEQDTGGYLASVIRSSNWPNDSVACAASEWHFVAVEKQKTASGWNLNYYLNGAIWLQVAFTADFVPFDASDNPFWFGGKTTDSGRWFKGEVNKLRVTMGARYGGKAFAVPDRLTDYAAPAGQPVWTKGIDRSRLLPDVSSLTQADDGKVMQFKFTSAEAEVPFCCNCQALMPDTTNQLVNDSGTGTTLTLGNTLAVSDVPGPFGGNCVSGIGNDGDSYTISISPRVAFSAADDFTLEWWLRPPTNALNETFLYFCKENGNYDYSWRIYNGAFWQMSSEIIPASEISSLALKANDWNFLVLCRKSGMFRLFINGIRVFSKSWQWAPPESVTFWKFAGGVSGVSNYCGGFRYSRSALYENDFEVPTAPFSVNAGREMVLDFMREATTSKAGAMSAADKAKLDSISTSSVSWYTISDANTITLDRANGELQKVTLTQNCTLTAPVLDADHPTLLLQVTSSSAVTVTVGETNIVTDHTGTFQVGWFYDGETTRRYPVVEVA